MKTRLFLLTIFLISSIGFSQNKVIEIITSQDAKGYILSAKNNSNVQYEVTLTIFPTNLRGYRNPLKKLIPANSSVEMIKLYFIKNKKGKYRYSFTHELRMTDKEKIDYNKKLEKRAVTEIGNIQKGIIVFSKDGCPRCHYTTSYLLDNGVDFGFINTSKNDKHNKLMWELVKNDNPQLENLTFPVILIDGQISYNIEDLEELVSNLNK